MSILLEMIGRGWENFLARPNGSLSLRFYIQPTMASLLALRAGIEDAREGRQGYLWAILTRPERRLQLLHEGWRGAMTPFLLALVLDCIYQIIANGTGDDPTQARFARTTIVGGVFFLAPIVVLIIILVKAFGFAKTGLQAIAVHIPWVRT